MQDVKDYQGKPRVWRKRWITYVDECEIKKKEDGYGRHPITTKSSWSFWKVSKIKPSKFFSW
jgi:hypothetical protein